MSDDFDHLFPAEPMSRPPALPEAEHSGETPLPSRLRAARRDRPGLRLRGDLAAHQSRLRRRLARLSALALPPGPRSPAARRPRVRRPLSRRARLRLPGRGRQAARRRHDRASTFGARLEFRPEVPALRPQGPPCRDRAGRRPPCPRPASRGEGGAPARAPDRDARRPAPSDLRNLRDRAILLLGFAGGLRRSEIVGLVMSPEDLLEGSGWPEFFDDGVLLTLRGKTGWREVEIGRGSTERTCPVAALEAWLKFARIARGPLFRAVVGREVGSEAAQRTPCRAPGQAPGARRRRARRPFRARARGEIRGPLAARRARLVGRDRRTLRAEAPRPRLGGNDPPLPAPPRPLPGQPDQGCGPVNRPTPKAPSETARRGWGGSPAQSAAAPRFAVEAENAVAAAIAGLASRSSTCGYEGARDSSPLLRARDFRLAFSCAITNGPVANAPCRAFAVNALR